jgi:hypothetical protein
VDLDNTHGENVLAPVAETVPVPEVTPALLPRGTSHDEPFQCAAPKLSFGFNVVFSEPLYVNVRSPVTGAEAVISHHLSMTSVDADGRELTAATLLTPASGVLLELAVGRVETEISDEPAVVLLKVKGI